MNGNLRAAAIERPAKGRALTVWIDAGTVTFFRPILHVRSTIEG